MRVYLRGGKYWLDLKNPQGIRQRIPAFESKRASEAFGRNVEALRDCQKARERPDAALLQFIEGLSPDARERLARHGFIDPERAAAGKALEAHLVDYEGSMSAKGRAARHIRQEVAKIRKIARECRFNSYSDINAKKIHAWLAHQRNERDMGARTANSYASAFHTFCNWMIPDRASFNPLVNFPLFNESVDVRRERRALSPEEMRRLLWAAEMGEPFRRMTGTDRAMVYRTAMETGLRWSELRSLSRASFELTGKTPTVKVEAAYSKHRKEDVLPLRAELVDALRSYFSTCPALPTAPAFPMPKTDCGAMMLRFDLECTGNREQGLPQIPYRDEQGRVADFHALRHSFVTALARSGVHPSVAQSLARHSTITLTMDRYTHTVLESQQEALQGLPDLERKPNSESAAKTGTFDERGADAAESGESACAFQCAKPATIHRIPSDNIGHLPMKKAAGAESDFPLCHNEKTLSGMGRTGVSDMVTPSGLEPEKAEPKSAVLPITPRGSFAKLPPGFLVCRCRRF